MAIYNIYKELGETPLECLERTRIEFGLPLDLSMTYVGRLDPAAVGKMIIITGDDIKNKETYLKSEKNYEVEFVVGIKTDTGDLLGLVQDFSDLVPELSQNTTQDFFNKLVGLRDQEFHNFSSKVVDGKPLWQHAKDGNEIKITHQVDIKRIDVISVTEIPLQDILIKVKNLVDSVHGEFRQDKIWQSWQNLQNINTKLLCIKINTHVSSGTYMRVLGEEFGKLINRPVCAYSIDRKEIIL